MKQIPIAETTSKALTGKRVGAYQADSIEKSRWTTRDCKQQIYGRETIVAAAPSLAHLKAMSVRAEVNGRVVAFGGCSGPLYRASPTADGIFLEPPPGAEAPRGCAWRAPCAFPEF